MISKLSRWVWAGAWALAFVAGMVNVVGLLGFEHQAVTHLTGTTTGSVIPLSSSPGGLIALTALAYGSYEVRQSRNSTVTAP